VKPRPHKAKYSFLPSRPHHFWWTSIDQPPKLSVPAPGRGNPAAGQREEEEGCSRTPPQLRTFSTAKRDQNTFLVGSGLSKRAKTTPGAAGRMSNNGIGPVVGPSIARQVKNIAAGKALIDAIGTGKRTAIMSHLLSQLGTGSVKGMEAVPGMGRGHFRTMQ